MIQFATNIVAQSINLQDLDNNDVNDGTIRVQGSIDDNLLELGLKVTNTSANDISIKVKKEEVSVIEGSENYFCWKECYAPDVFVSPDFLLVEAGVTKDRSFKGDYKPNQNSGETKIRYTFFDMNNETDKATVLVVFEIPTTTKITPVSNNTSSFSKSFPVPANNFVTIEYNLNQTNNITLQIFNLKGSKIEERTIEQSSGELIINSDSYKSGSYIYQFTKEGKILDSGKFIFQ